MHAAFAFMDARVVMAALVGLVCSVAFVYVYSAQRHRPALSNDEWRAFQLVEKRSVSKSTNVYRFAIPHKLGLPIGQHVSVRALINGRYVMRSYTPISDYDATGYVDLLIKTYEKGNVSRVVNTLRVGDTLEMKGPRGKFRYSRNMAPEIGMVAGGTGITPCLQILHHALRDPKDTTRFRLIYANVSADEILLRTKLDELARDYPQRFSVHYFLNVPPPDWRGGVGFVSREALQTYLPAASADCRILMCGPPPMMEAMRGHLRALDFAVPDGMSSGTDKVFVF